MRKPVSRLAVEAPIPDDEGDPIFIVDADPSTGVVTITIPALHSQTGKPTVVKVDPNVTANVVMGIIKALING